MNITITKMSYGTVGTPVIYKNQIDETVSVVTTVIPYVLDTLSSKQTCFTGSTPQTVNLPVANTLAIGQAFTIVNASTATVTIQTSGGNTLFVLAAGATITVICANPNGGAGIASWQAATVTDVKLDSSAAVPYPTAPETQGVWYGNSTRANVSAASNVLIGNNASAVGSSNSVTVGNNTVGLANRVTIVGADSAAAAVDTTIVGYQSGNRYSSGIENTSVGAYGMNSIATFTGVITAAPASGTYSALGGNPNITLSAPNTFITGQRFVGTLLPAGTYVTVGGTGTSFTLNAGPSNNVVNAPYTAPSMLILSANVSIGAIAASMPFRNAGNTYTNTIVDHVFGSFGTAGSMYSMVSNVANPGDTFFGYSPASGSTSIGVRSLRYNFGDSNAAVGENKVLYGVSTASTPRIASNVTIALCTTTLGSAVITTVNSGLLQLNQNVTGFYIPTGSYVVSINAGVSFTINAPALGGASGISLTGTTASMNRGLIGDGNVIIGKNAFVSSVQTTNAVVIGTHANALATVASGTSTSPTSAIAIGYLSNVAGVGGIAIGGTSNSISNGPRANGNKSIAIGCGDSGAGPTATNNGIAIGSSATLPGILLSPAGAAASDNAISMGTASQAGPQSLAIGVGARAPADGIAIGYNAVSAAGNFRNIAIGPNSVAAGPNNSAGPSIAIGYATNTQADSVAVGSSSTSDFAGAVLGNRAIGGAYGTSVGHLSNNVIPGSSTGFYTALGATASPIDNDHTLAFTTNNNSILGGSLNISAKSGLSQSTIVTSNRGYQLPLYPTLEQKNYISTPIVATFDGTMMPQAAANVNMYCSFNATVTGAGPVYTVTMDSNVGNNGLFVIGMNIGTTTGTIGLKITSLVSGTLGLTGSTYTATVIPGANNPVIGVSTSVRGCTASVVSKPYGKFAIGMTIPGGEYFGFVSPSFVISAFSANFTGANYVDANGNAAAFPLVGFAFDAGNYFNGPAIARSIYGTPSFTIAGPTVPTLNGSTGVVGMALIGPGITPGTTIMRNTLGVDLAINSSYTMRSQATARVTQQSGTVLVTTPQSTISAYISNSAAGTGAPGTQLSVISGITALSAGTPISGPGIADGTIITSCQIATATTATISAEGFSVAGVVGRWDVGMLVTGVGVPPDTYILRNLNTDTGNLYPTSFALSKGMIGSVSLTNVTGSICYVNKSQIVPRAIITSATSGSDPTVFTARNTFTVGQSIEIYGVTPSSYNGIYTVSAATSTTFSVVGALSGYTAAGYAVSQLTVNAGSTCGFRPTGSLQVNERSYPYTSLSSVQFNGTFANIATGSTALSAVPNTNIVTALPIGVSKVFAVSATSGTGVIQTYTTTASTFLPGELVTVTGAGAYNVTDAAIQTATATSFTVFGTATSASTTGTATVAANNTLYVQSILGFPSTGKLLISNKETVSYTSTSAGSLGIVCGGAIVSDGAITPTMAIPTTSGIQLSYGQYISFVTNPSATVSGGAPITGTFTLTVDSTHNFPTVGTISVPTTVSSPQSVTYTGITANSFTGCTLVGGGSFTTAAGSVTANFTATPTMVLNSTPGVEIRIPSGTYPNYTNSTYTVTIDRPSFALSSLPTTAVRNDPVGLVQSYEAYPSICDTDLYSTSAMQYYENGAGAPFNYDVVMPTPVLRGPGFRPHDSNLYYAPGVEAGFSTKIINRAPNATVRLLDGAGNIIGTVANGAKADVTCVSTSTAPFWDIN